MYYICSSLSIAEKGSGKIITNTPSSQIAPAQMILFNTSPASSTYSSLAGHTVWEWGCDRIEINLFDVVPLSADSRSEESKRKYYKGLCYNGEYLNHFETENHLLWDGIWRCEGAHCLTDSHCNFILGCFNEKLYMLRRCEDVTQTVLGELNRSYQERFGHFSDATVQYCGKSESIEKRKSKQEKRQAREIQRKCRDAANDQYASTAALTFLFQNESVQGYQRKRLM